MSQPQNRIRDSIYGMKESSEFVAHHPTSATVSAFGLGLGVGVALVFLLTDSSQNRRDEGLSHRLGRMVLDTISQAIPESLARLRD